jgi:hypothetical protein
MSVSIRLSSKMRCLKRKTKPKKLAITFDDQIWPFVRICRLFRLNTWEDDITCPTKFSLYFRTFLLIFSGTLLGYQLPEHKGNVDYLV